MPTNTININVSTVGASILNTASPSAVTWIRVNADNTITYRTAAQTLSDLGAQVAGTYLVPADIGVTVQGYSANTTLLGNSTTGSGAIVLATSPTFVTDISAPKIISSTASGGLLLCNNNGVTVASFGVGSAGSTNIALIGATAVTGTISGTSSLTLGTAATTVGSIVLQNATNANTLTIQSGVTSASYSVTLPTAQGGANTYLKNDGTGVLSWASAGGVAGSDTQVQYNDGGSQAGDADFTWNKTTNILNTSGGYAIGGTTILTYAIYSGPSYAISLGNNTINAAHQLILDPYGSQSPAAQHVTIVGSRNGAGVFGSVSLGSYAGQGTTMGGQATALGFFTAATFGSSIALGSCAVTTKANQLVIGGDGSPYTGGSSVGISEVVIGNGVTNATATSVTIQPTSGTGTNNAGGSLTLAGGKGTGTAAGGTYKSQTSVKGSSGTTLQSLTDRHTVPAKYVDITGGAATTFGQLALATSGTVAGGIVVYTIEANDGTDYQSLSGTLRYDVVNKAGTLTVVYSDTQNGAGACSAGTLTATVTATVSGTNVLFQANAVSSLSETVLRVSFQVLNNFGVATITAA